MQNNQHQYLRSDNYEPYTTNNYSISQNWNNQQRFNYDGNSNRTINDYDNQRCLSSTSCSPQCNYEYGCRPSGTITSNYGINDRYYGQDNNRGVVGFHPTECCGSKDDNLDNQYGHNDQLNSYNCFDTNTYPPSSLTNRALNIHMNGLDNNSPNSNFVSTRHFQQPNLSCLSSQTTSSGADDLASNSCNVYQRKSC